MKGITNEVRMSVMGAIAID